jgi:hypothetical protein
LVSPADAADPANIEVLRAMQSLQPARRLNAGFGEFALDPMADIRLFELTN